MERTPFTVSTNVNFTKTADWCICGIVNTMAIEWKVLVLQKRRSARKFRPFTQRPYQFIIDLMWITFARPPNLCLNCLWRSDSLISSLLGKQYEAYLNAWSISFWVCPTGKNGTSVVQDTLCVSKESVYANMFLILFSLVQLKTWAYRLASSGQTQLYHT